MSEHGPEPVPGLPESLPQGEEILWQGAPEARSLARRGFHVDKVVIYFGIAILAVITADVTGGTGLGAALASAVWLLLPLAIAAALLGGLAWLYARMTVYTITSARVVIRSGIALPTAVNLPFDRVQSAGVKSYRDGTGDLALQLDRTRRPSLAMLWPNVRPFHWSRPEPTLRCIDGADAVADLLGRALQARAAGTAAGMDPAAAETPGAATETDSTGDRGRTTGSGDRVTA